MIEVSRYFNSSKGSSKSLPAWNIRNKVTLLDVYFLDRKRIWNPIDFQGQKSRSQGLIFRGGDTPRFALPLLLV
jgi:hypothetical protein